MKKYFKKLLTHFRENSFLKIYFWVCVPILVLIVCEMIIYIFNYNTYVDMITDNYRYRLETLSAENDSSICNIADSLFILSTNDDFMQLVASPEYILISASSPVYSTVEKLNMVKESSKFIDEICIMKRNADNTTISYNVERSADAYFGNAYVYSGYDTNFWLDYSPPLSGIDYLAPTTVITKEEKKFVYPIVFSKIGEKTLNNNYIIVNIDIGKITNTVADEALTTKTDVVMLHNESGKYYDARKNDYMQIDDDFYDKIIKSSNNTFYFNDHGAKYAVSHSPKNSPFGYSYAMTVPRSELFSSQLSVLLIAFVLLILALFAVFLSSKKLFKPWQSLESMFSSKKESENTVDFVRSAVEKTIENNSEISEKLSSAMPFVQERYLIELLHSGGSENLDNAPISFRYPYFASVIIKLRRTSKFSQLYSDDGYINIRTGIFNILEAIFNEKYDTFLILNDNDTLYMILNTAAPDDDETILDMLHRFEDLLKYDRDYISVHIGFGGTAKGISGLKSSHAAAANLISALPGVNALDSSDSDAPAPSENYSLSMDNENKLYNYLLVGNVGDAESLIKSISNREKGADRHMLVQLYVQIIHVIMKAMKSLRIPFTDESKSEVEMLYEIMACEPLEIYETIFRLLKRVEAKNTAAETHIMPEKILEYINEHYTDELSLNFLADKFNISPSYLSKIIKKRCGVGFAGYIAALRIDNAKKLLLTTNKTITDIYTESGFNNRRTFIRTFKAYVGVSPTEFKKTAKE